jgi:hypothetical protein
VYPGLKWVEQLLINLLNELNCGGVQIKYEEIFVGIFFTFSTQYKKSKSLKYRKLKPLRDQYAASVFLPQTLIMLDITLFLPDSFAL